MKKRMVRKPELMIEDAVSRMLPKNKLGKQMFTKLKVYRGRQASARSAEAGSEGVCVGKQGLGVAQVLEKPDAN